MYIAIDKLPNCTMYGFDIKAPNHAKRDDEDGFTDVLLCQENIKSLASGLCQEEHTYFWHDVRLNH